MEWARYRAESGEAAEAVKQIRAVMPEIRKNYAVGASLARYLEGAARVFDKTGLFRTGGTQRPSSFRRLPRRPTA
jgi:hypothetical protein